jgi:hypothetical protein
MEEKYKIIPLGIDYPYSLEDLSVIIPHASWYPKRLSWFLERYFRGTPTEVIKNTILVCDPDDQYSFDMATKYGIKSMQNKKENRDYSTLKLQLGFEEVKTRLCVRLHNDAQIMRNDWADILIKQFNSTKIPQLIGAWHPSGNISKDGINRLVELFPWFSLIKDNLDFLPNDKVGAEYFHAFFMAGQTYIFRDIYPQIVKYNDEKMDIEDVLFSQLVSSYNIQLTAWNNMPHFINCVATKSSDFEEDDKINQDMPIIISEENKGNYPQPEWKVVN